MFVCMHVMLVVCHLTLYYYSEEEEEEESGLGQDEPKELSSERVELEAQAKGGKPLDNSQNDHTHHHNSSSSENGDVPAPFSPSEHRSPRSSPVPPHRPARPNPPRASFSANEATMDVPSVHSSNRKTVNSNGSPSLKPPQHAAPRPPPPRPVPPRPSLPKAPGLSNNSPNLSSSDRPTAAAANGNQSPAPSPQLRHQLAPGRQVPPRPSRPPPPKK